MPVATLRQHRSARLLQKPQLKSVLANCGKTLTPALLNDADGDPTVATRWRRRDWIRCHRKIPAWFERRPGMQAAPQTLIAYEQTVLAPHRALWDEAMLSAALSFIREELGIARVWMHTPESGQLVKRIRYSAPPHSVYSTLPHRFCFETTREFPAFLQRNKAITREMRRQPDLALRSLRLDGDDG